jgi:hypothetical protein
MTLSGIRAARSGKMALGKMRRPADAVLCSLHPSMDER